MGRIVHESSFDGIEQAHQYQDGDLIHTRFSAQGSTQRHIHMQRDLLGRLVERSDASQTEQLAYDAGGRLCQITRTPSAQGKAQGITPNTLGFEYDLCGRLIAEIGPYGRVEQTLDKLGHEIECTLPRQHVVRTLRYGSGHVHQIAVNQQIVSDFERDALHRATTRSQGTLHQRTGYDLLGRKLWQSSDSNNPAPPPYDSAPVDTQSVAAILHTPYRSQWQAARTRRLWRTWQYQPEGQLAQQDDSLRQLQEYQHDANGQMRLRSSHPAKAWPRHEAYRYDAAGNVLAPDSATLPVNRLHHWQQQSDTWRYAYNALGSLAKGMALARNTLSMTMGNAC